MAVPNALKQYAKSIVDAFNPFVPSAGDNIVRLIENDDLNPDPFVFEFAINPEESIKFDGEQSIAEIPIPAAAGSILQSLGSSPLRISFHGVFEDVYSADGKTLVRRAVTDVQVLEDMRMSGKTWTLKYLDIEHQVKIKTFGYTITSPRGNLDRFDYELLFLKVYPNLGFERSQLPLMFFQQKEISTAQNAVVKFLKQVNDTLKATTDAVARVSTAILAPITDFTGLANNIFDQLEETGNIINNVIGNTARAVQTPQRELEQLQQRIEYNITTVQQMQANLKKIANVGQDLFIAFNDLNTQLLYLQKLPTLKPSPPTTYTVIEGDRIEDIASAFYGDSEAWRPIAEANKLPDPSVLSPGQVLLIPV